MLTRLENVVRHVGIGAEIPQNRCHASVDMTLRFIGGLYIEQPKPPKIPRADLRWPKSPCPLLYLHVSLPYDLP
jgi:hypothetical protein